MINQSGVFVLFGSKPLCEGGFLDDVARRNPGPYCRNPLKGWEAWEKIKPHLKGTRYILIKKTAPISLIWPDQRVDNRISHRIILADVLKTAFVLSENYEIFKELTGMDFHPLEIVFDLENPDSVFWNRIFGSKQREGKSHFYANMANGLLFGFGKKNALLFSWRDEMRGKNEKIDAFFESFSLHPDDLNKRARTSKEIWRKGARLLEILGFVSDKNDDIVERYENEKIKIQQFCTGKDFLEVTLQQLSK